MEVYLVGGAVRDELLGLPIHERDYVVVGSTPAAMIASGYQQVGKDFPVFLHPETQEEYALARTERKAGKGYTGFECFADPSVTLEQDLERRDLTINAIAKSATGELIDPFHGLNDLANKKLKHVSLAFVEDPLRVLRVARFAARFAHLGFQVANETLQLMKEIVASGEMQELVPERVWQEMRKALLTQDPQVFFKVLAQVNALQTLFPFTQNTVPQFTFLKRATSLSLKHRHANSEQIDIRFAAWCADHLAGRLSGKPLEGNDAFQKSFEQILTDTAILPLPRSTQQLFKTGLGHLHMVPNTNTEAADDIALLNRCDAWRQPERLGIFITLWSAIFPKYEAHLAKLHSALPELLKVDVRAAVADGLKGAEIGKYVEQERILSWQALK